MDIAELGYRVDSSGLAEGTKALDENAAAADKVSGATDRLERDFQSLSRTVERSSSALGDRLGGALDRIGTGTGAVITELQALNQTNASILTALGAMEGKLASTASNLRAVGSAANTVAAAEQQVATASQQLERELASQDARLKSVAQQAVQYAESMRGANVSERALAEAARDAAAGIDVKARAMAAGGTEQQRMVARAKALEEAERRTAQQQKEAARASQVQELNLQKLLGQIEPTVAALGRLADQEERLARARDLGLLKPQVWQQYQNQLDATRARTLEASRATGSLTGSIGKLNLNSIEAQQSVANLLRSLASGDIMSAQSSITSLTARTGAMGGVFTATGVAIGGSVAALGLVGWAAAKGYLELRELDRTLIGLGGSAGTLSGMLLDARNEIGRLTGEYEGAGTAITQALSSGVLFSQQAVAVAAAATNIASLTGKSISSVTSSIMDLADGGSEALVKLNRQYGFLTAATYNQIEAIRQERGEGAALQAAIVELERVSTDRVRKMEDSAGALERAWGGVKRQVNSVLQSMKNVGRNDIEHQLQQAVENLAMERSAQERRNRYGNSEDKSVRQLAAEAEVRRLLGVRMELQERQFAEERQRLREKDLIEVQAAAQAEAKTASDALDARIAGLDRESAKLKARNEIIAQYNKLAANDPKHFDGSMQRLIASAEAELDKRFNRQEGSNKRNGDDSAAQNMLATALRQIEANKQLVDTGVKVTESERQAMAIEQALAKGKNTMTASTRALLAAAREELLASGQKAAAYTKEKEAAEALARQQAILAQAGANRDRANELDLMGMGRGSDAVAMLRRQLDIQREYQDELKRLGSRDVAKDKKTWDLLAANAASFRDSELAKERGFQETRLAMLGDWRAGVNRVWEDYVFAARNAMDQAGGVMNTALSGWEDAWVRLAQTGKLSFSDMANSIIADLARIGARQTSMGLVNAIAGAWGGFGGGAGGAVASTYSAQSFGNNTGWLNSGLSFGGGRASGGSTRAGSFYQVGEGGRPELFEQNGRQYLIPGDSGRVIPAAPGRGDNGRGEAPRVNVIINNAPAGTSAEASVTQGANGEMNIELMLKQVDQYIGSNIASGTGATYAGAKARFGLQETV